MRIMKWKKRVLAVLTAVSICSTAVSEGWTVPSPMIRTAEAAAKDGFEIADTVTEVQLPEEINGSITKAETPEDVTAQRESAVEQSWQMSRFEARTPVRRKFTPIKYGDVNGDGTITEEDHTLVQQYIQHTVTLTGDRFIRADVDGNGVVDITDSVTILRYLKGIESKFPVESKLNNISIYRYPDKTTFYVGETFSTSGLKITVQYNDGSTSIISSGFSSSGGDTSTAGTKTVTVSYTLDDITKTTTYTITVIKYAQVLTGTTSYTKYVDDADFKLNVNHSKGDGTLSYASSDTSVATVSSGGMVQIKGVGNTTITVTASATTKYNKATLSVTITVILRNQILTGTKFYTKYADDTEFKLDVTHSAGDGALSYISSDTSVATVSSGGMVQIKGVGNTRITVTAVKTAIYKETDFIVQIEVIRRDQTITGTGSYTKKIGDEDFVLDVRISKGNGTLSYKSGNEGVVTVSETGVVHIEGPGNTNIKVTASETGSYNRTSRQINITVNPGPTTDPVHQDEGDFIYAEDGETLIEYRGTPVNGVVVIPGNTKKIAEDVFKNRTDIISVYMPRSVTEIADGAFGGCSSLHNVFYEGSQDEWLQLENRIGKNNDDLLNATIYFLVPTPPIVIKTLPHLFGDCEHKSNLLEGGLELYANGGSVKSGAAPVNYKQASLYTDITASYHYTYDGKGKQKSSTGKVIVGITTSKMKPILTSKNKIEDKNAENIAEASIANGKITVKAKSLPGTVYLWVIDTGDAPGDDGRGYVACCPVTVKSAPTKINLYSFSADKYEATAVKYTSDSINVGSSKYVYVYPTYKNGTNMVKAEDATYSVCVEEQSVAYFSVTQMTGNCFAVTAKALKGGKAVKGKIYVTCNQNGKKATFTVTAVNHVKEIGISEPSLLKADKGRGIVTISLPEDKKQKRGVFKLNPIGEDEGTAVTDAQPTLYAMKNPNSFKITKKGTVSVTEKPAGDQTMLKAGYSKGTVTVTAVKNAVPATVYYLVVYHTLNENGYRVITIKAVE